MVSVGAIKLSNKVIKNLVVQFRNAPEVLSASYKEIWVREQFIDPMLNELGWKKITPGAILLDGIVSEDRLRNLGMVTSPDYGCYVKGQRHFFIEAKKPSVNIQKSINPAYQIRKYGWNANLPVGLLTDFQEFGFYDCRIAPNLTDPTDRGRFEYFSYEELPEKWDWICQLISRDSVIAGSLEAFASQQKKVPGAVPIGEAFLLELDRFRNILAKDLAGNNSIDSFHFSEIVQLILDRIIFLRICESRGIEQDGTLFEIVKEKDVLKKLTQLFIKADQRYNSGLFAQHLILDNLSKNITLSDQALSKIIKGLYPPSPYEFSMIGSDVLAQVYERFLGKVIQVDKNKVKIEDRPEVKKAGGVIYTPPNIVRHMVSAIFQEYLDGNRKLENLKICDPACGSGSFLIEVYNELSHLFLSKYVSSNKQFSSGKSPRIISDNNGDWLLSSSEKKRILTDHIFGVDLDPQAVEVTKLSLLLKVLEGESASKLERQLELFRERALPNLNDNIQCGNTLVGVDIFQNEQNVLFDVELRNQIKPYDWKKAFPAIFTSNAGGFDLIVGNPPYVLLEDDFRNPVTDQYFRKKYKVATYKIDTYHLFLEKSLDLLKQGGMIVFITPTNWMTNNYLESLRRLLLEKNRFVSIDVLDNSAFKGRSVDTAILMLEKGTQSLSKFPLRRISSFSSPIKIISNSEIDPGKVRNSQGLLFSAGEYSSNSLVFDKFESKVQNLGNIARVNFGKQLRDRKKFKQDVIEVDSLDKVPRTHRACYTGKNISRWHVEWSGLACLNSVVAKGGGCWDDEIQNAINKILCKQIGLYPEFGLDTNGMQCLNTAFMITINKDINLSPLVLVGILNSSLISAYWLDKFWDRRRTFPKVKGTFLKELPIPLHFDPNLATDFENKVKMATQLTKEIRKESNPASIKNLLNLLSGIEDELDLLVCDMYELDRSAVALFKSTIASVVTVKNGN